MLRLGPTMHILQKSVQVEQSNIELRLPWEDVCQFGLQGNTCRRYTKSRCHLWVTPRFGIVFGFSPQWFLARGGKLACLDCLRLWRGKIMESSRWVPQFP